MLLPIKIVTKILTGVIKPKQAYLLIFFLHFYIRQVGGCYLALDPVTHMSAPKYLEFS